MELYRNDMISAPGAIAVGVDLVEVRRIAALSARYGQCFLARVFTPQEQQECGGRANALAARFAAKEATGKVLGTGLDYLTPGGVSLLEIEITSNAPGLARVTLAGRAAACAQQLGLAVWSAAYACTATQAIALVIATHQVAPVNR